MYEVKILLVGPCQAGKSTLANFLSDATENPISPNYRPTHVVRILEFESANLNISNQVSKVDVELWDASGNHSFSGSWPSLVRDAHGIILMLDPSDEQQIRELQVFYDEFVEKSGITSSQCIVFANVRPGGRGLREVKLGSQFSRIPQLEVNIEDEGNRVRNDFNTFLSTVISNLMDRHNQEEMNIINIKG